MRRRIIQLSASIATSACVHVIAERNPAVVFVARISSRPPIIAQSLTQLSPLHEAKCRDDVGSGGDCDASIEYERDIGVPAIVGTSLALLRDARMAADLSL